MAIEYEGWPRGKSRTSSGYSSTFVVHPARPAAANTRGPRLAPRSPCNKKEVANHKNITLNFEKP